MKPLKMGRREGGRLMKCDVVDLSAKKKGSIDLDEGVFGVDLREDLLARSKVAIIAPTGKNSQDKTAQ